MVPLPVVLLPVERPLVVLPREAHPPEARPREVRQAEAEVPLPEVPHRGVHRGVEGVLPLEALPPGGRLRGVGLLLEGPQAAVLLPVVLLLVSLGVRRLGASCLTTLSLGVPLLEVHLGVLPGVCQEVLLLEELRLPVPSLLDRLGVGRLFLPLLRL